MALGLTLCESRNWPSPENTRLSEQCLASVTSLQTEWISRQTIGNVFRRQALEIGLTGPL